VNWVERLSGSQSSSLTGVVYGNRQFLVVGADTILSSADGVTWVQRQSGTLNLSGVAFGNGQFVAVGGGYNWATKQYESASLTSSDGVTWVQRQSGTQALRLDGIAYGNGQFVAVGAEAAIFTSNDGVRWIPRTPRLSPPFWDTGTSITYGNGYFVAAGNDCCRDSPNSFQTSADGVNWVQSNGVTWNFLSGVAYGNSYFVAVGPCGTILQSGPIIRLSITANTEAKLGSLSLEGPAGLAYIIQTSTDLISWRNLTNLTTAADGTARFDALPAASEHLFYRTYSQ
jgi:hypothetical protein